MAGRRLIGQRRRQATLPPIGTGSNGLGRCQRETLLIFNFPLKMTRFRPSLIDGRHFVPRELTPPPRPLDSSFHIEIHSSFFVFIFTYYIDIVFIVCLANTICVLFIFMLIQKYKGQSLFVQPRENNCLLISDAKTIHEGRILSTEGAA